MTFAGVMLNTLFICLGMLQGSKAMLTSDQRNNYLEDMGSNLNEMGAFNYPVGKVKVPTLTRSESLSRKEFARRPSESEETREDYSLLNPRVLSYSLEEPNREERSLKRCAQLSDLCMGDIPCCHPCATCRCRFYGVYCYCRKINHSCHINKN